MDINRSTTSNAPTSLTTHHARPPSPTPQGASPGSPPQLHTRVAGGDDDAVRLMEEAYGTMPDTINVPAPPATPPQPHPTTTLLDLPNESLHQLTHFLRTANTIPAIRNVARFRAACKDLHSRIPKPIPEGLMGLVEFNCMDELKHLLARLRRSGKDVAKGLDSPTEAITIVDPELPTSCLTPLMAAAYLGHAELVRVLIEAGASIDQAIDDQTALHLAARRGHTECVQVLLQAGAGVDQIESHGWTALMLAASHGHTVTVQALLQAGARIDQVDSDRTTALMFAPWHGHTGIVQALLEAGAMVDQADSDGVTALMFAAHEDDIVTVQALLEAGAGVDQVDANGQTALMCAAESGQAAIVQALLLAGADHTLRTRQGETALSFAIKSRCREIENLLRSYGAAG